MEKKSRLRLPRGGAGRFNVKQESIARQHADLLRQVRVGDALSRVDLARSLNLAPSTVGIYVDHLVEEGFLFEGRTKERDFGRPPTILALNPHGGRFIGVDFEARNIMAVAVDFSQKPLKHFHDTISVGESVEKILQRIERAIETVATEESTPLLGIGVGVPGITDPETGVALHYKHIPGWKNVPLVQRLAGRFHAPVYLENNIRTMALAEMWFGQGRGVRNFICVGVRSGVGMGIIIDGQIYRGAQNRAGEIGEWPCVSGAAQSMPSESPFAPLEEVTSFGLLQERLSSSPSPGSDSLVAPGTELPVERLVQAAQAGDAMALDILDRAARVFGLALNQVYCAFNPEKIIIAGVFTAFGNLFLRRLKEHLALFAPSAGPPPVVNSTLGPYNGAFGAAALAVHEWKPMPA